MATQAEQLAELQALNAQLGLSEDDGMPLTYEQKIAELRALDEELASTPESFGEYVERRKVEDSRSFGDKTSAFTDSFITGAGALASEGSKAIGELFSGNVGKSEIGGVFKIGMADFKRFAETLGGSAMDNFYSDEEEMKREYERYKDNFLYNQNVRTAMLNTYDEEGRDFISFGANFVDPTLLIPGAGLLTKGASLGAKAVATGAKAGAFAARSPRLVQLSRAMAKTSRGAQKVAKGLDKVSDVASIPAKLAASGTRKAIKGSALIGSKIAGGVGKTGELTSKVAALPRTAVIGFASKFIDPKIAGSGILGAQATGALTGAVPGLGLLTGAEALGYIANKTGRGVERTLSALASTGGQKRFLQRLATSADSPRLRKLALMAHAGGATKLTDLAFNSLVNGASVGVLNGALAYASGEGAEGVGAAVGSGTLMGGSLPFGQPGMKGGKSQAARDQSSINFLNAKLADDQIKQFKKLSPEARLAFATVEEAGIPSPQLKFLDKQTYLDFLRQDDPNLRSAPNAHYGIADNTIYINQDGNAGRSSKEAMDILTHELGHHFIKQAIKDDPFFAEKILSEYKAKPGEESFDFAFTTDSAGAPIDSIKLNKKAVDIADLYGGIQDGIGIGRNAEKLAQEIGAEQFAMMMVDNPNIFKTIEPSLRQKLLDGSRKVLTMFGAVDGNTGNPLDISILGKEVRSKNPLVQRSKSIKNLYKNYVKQREYALADKIDLAENPMKIKLQRGEKPQQAVQRLFNTKGISLKEAGAFRINNRKVKEKLVEIKKRLLENPTGGMRAFVNKSGNAIAIKGKTLSDEVRSVFTRNDPFGNINTLINVAQEAIRDKAQLNFLYRSGKPSKYSDNELRPRVISPVGFNITGLSDRSTSAASLKLDSFDEAYLRNNAEVLVQEGFAKDPNALIEEGRRVAKESLTDSEGRINPKGKQENELVTALFGQPESAGFIKNKKLRVLLEEGRLRHAFRSYDFDALAGLVPTGRDGISFDWDNVKHNHMPLDDKLFMPTEIQEGSPGSFFRPKSSRDKSARLRTFKSPVYLKDGSRLSGVADNPEQNPFYGYDKNGQEFSQGREYINPQDITKSRDSDRTANQIRNELESGQKLFHPAYHGTPHTLAPEAGAPLGKFRTSAIGTGEGAQAYGHGLYFAGKQDVAQWYFENLNKEYLYDGKEYNPSDIRHEAAKIVAKHKMDYESALAEVESRLYSSEDSPYLQKLHELVGMEKHAEISPKGSVYKVELAPKENEYLLYDKTLGEQPKGVQDKLKKFLREQEGEDTWQYRQEQDYRDITNNVLDDMPEPEISRRLKEAGIPGIKYLDGSSRSKGEGDYNYVIFDEADVTVTEKLFMPASEAGAGKGKVAEATKLWNEKGIDSPYFKKFSGGAKIVKIGEQHDFVSGEPVVVEGVHGSTHTFKEFDPSKGNPESDLGKAVYISNTPDEVGVNYAGEGPDLTGRIERKAETYMGIIEDELSSYGLSDDATQQQIEAKGYELARNELVGSGDQTYKVFAKFKNPVVVGEKFRSIDDFRNKGGKKETNFEMMFDEDAGTESGTLVDLLEQVDEVAYDFEFVDVDKVKSDIMEAADYDSIGAQELIKTMKESEGLMDTMDADGELANGEFVRQVFEGMGFDGIIDLSVNEKFGSQRRTGKSMEGMNPDTIHYLAFKPEQIKSATGNRGTFDAGERNILFMPASEAKNPKSGDMLTLDDSSLKLFLPSPSNPNASLSDFKGKNVQVLTADLSVVGDKKADGAMISFTGGPGYLSVNDAWGFTNEAGAKAFKTRWERDGKPLIGITSMKQENHRASTLTREYYVRKFMEAINGGKISENTVNRHIKTALKRAIDGKNGLTNKQKEALKTVKTIEDFLKVFPDKELIPWKATPMIYGKLDAKTLPIKQDRLKKLGLDTDTILRETRQPEYNDIKKGSLLAIAEYDGSGATYRPDLNSAYPWSIPLNEKAFLKDFADIQNLSSRQDLRGSDGEANMAVAMGAGVMLDKLGRGDVNFMPSDPKAPKAQPANRITRQAPAMPGNRFMAPAVSAGAKSAERFR